MDMHTHAIEGSMASKYASLCIQSLKRSWTTFPHDRLVSGEHTLTNGGRTQSARWVNGEQTLNVIGWAVVNAERTQDANGVQTDMKSERNLTIWSEHLGGYSPTLT